VANSFEHSTGNDILKPLLPQDIVLVDEHREDPDNYDDINMRYSTESPIEQSQTVSIPDKSARLREHLIDNLGCTESRSLRYLWYIIKNSIHLQQREYKYSLHLQSAWIPDQHRYHLKHYQQFSHCLDLRALNHRFHRLLILIWLDLLEITIRPVMRRIRLLMPIPEQISITEQHCAASINCY